MSQVQDQIAQISDLLLDAYEARVSDLKKSIDLAQLALTKSLEVDCKPYVAKSYSHLSLFHMILGDYDESMKLADMAINAYGELGDDRGVADAMYNVAGIYYKTNNFHSGLIYLVDCLSIYRKYDDFHNQARVLKSLGTIYEYFGDQTSAIESYQESVICGRKVGDKNLQSNAFNPLSGIYLNRGQIGRAMEVIEQSIQMKEETGDIRGLAFALYGRGKVYAKREEFDLAEADYLKSLETHAEMGEKLGTGMVLNKLGALYLAMGDVERAKARTHEALDFSIKSKTAFIKFKAYYQLYLIAKRQKETVLALDYLEKYLNEKENVINAQTHKIIEAYQVISEKQNLEIEAETQREKAEIIEKKNRELDAFFYKVSHDLKGPISSIIGLDNVVREKITDPRALTYFDIYKKQVYRINNILDELMRITRIDHYSENKEEIDFEGLISDCISALSYLPNHEHIGFDVEVGAQLNFKSEWSTINTIFHNLVENAVKYADGSKNQSTAIIKVYQDQQHLVIRAEDNGIGMDSEVEARAFEMFYKADSMMEGSGLGLYILNRAVEKLSGKVDLKTSPNVGSTFTIRLPYA